MADTIFYGGEIITMDDKTLRSGKVEAVAVAGDTIIEVGSIEKVFRRKGPNTQMILLNGQTLMPGFIEPHQHAVLCSLVRAGFTNISALNYRSYAEISDVIKAKLQSITDAGDTSSWGLFFGWDPELISDLPALSKAYLDANFSSDIPIGIVGQSGHVSWANSAAFDVAQIPDDIENPEGGTFVRDEEGNLTGQMFEDPATMAVLGAANKPSGEEIKDAMVSQFRQYASVGLTTVTELAYEPGNLDPLLKAIASDDQCPIRLGMYRLEHAEKDPEPVDARMLGQQAAKRPRMSAAPKKPKKGCCGSGIAANVHTHLKAAPSKRGAKSEEEEGVGNFNGKLWEVGIKLVADGSPHCGTCAVREPFMNTPLTETLGFPTAPQYGILNYSTQALHDTIKKFHLQGKQLSIHCHGERACEQILKLYEQILSEDDDMDNKNRHRMEHLGLMTVEQIARAGKINTALSFFVDHLRFYAQVYKSDIFSDRTYRWAPVGEASKNNITWTIHQDHPTFPGDASPFANMISAVTRCHRDDPDHPYGAEFRVPIHEALKSYTVNAAWQLHLDNQVGTITQGKKADLVILTDNPYLKETFKLEEIKVVETFIGGRRNNIGKMTTLAPGINVLKRDPKNDA